MAPEEAAEKEAAQQEYDKVWEQEDAASAKPEKDIEAEDPPAAEAATEVKPAVPAAEAKPTVEKPASDPAPADGLKGVEKALHDTKQYATRLAEENAKLRKIVEGKNTEAQVEAAKASAKKAEEDLRASLDEAYKDYPELKTALDSITGELKSVKEKLSARDQQDEERAKRADELRLAKESFERDVKPEVLKVHADFDTIVSSPTGDFFKWAERSSPAIQSAVFQSTIASDIVWAVSEYKKAKAAGDIDNMKGAEERRKKNNQDLAHSLKAGATAIPSSSHADAKKGDYDAGWEEAGTLLEGKGARSL